MNVIVLLGASGVGKDTLARGLISQLGDAINFKVVSALKRKWEVNLGLPYEALELRCVKGKPILVDSDYTYGDWMVDEFHKSKINPAYRTPLIRRLVDEMTWYCCNNIIPICTDIRMPDEVDALMGLEHFCNIRPFILERSGVVPLSSDEYLCDNISTFVKNGYTVIRLEKDGSPELWVSQILSYLGTNTQA